MPGVLSLLHSVEFLLDILIFLDSFLLQLNILLINFGLNEEILIITLIVSFIPGIVEISETIINI